MRYFWTVLHIGVSEHVHFKVNATMETFKGILNKEVIFVCNYVDGDAFFHF